RLWMRQTEGMVSIQEDVTPEGFAECLLERAWPCSRPLVARTRGLADRTNSLASVKCSVKTVDESPPLEVDRLMPEAEGCGAQRACLNGLIGIGGNENDRYFRAETRQMVLHLQPAHPRHVHIQYQISRFGYYRRLQKRLG